MGVDIALIWPSGKAKYFLSWDLTTIPKNSIVAKTLFARLTFANGPPDDPV